MKFLKIADLKFQGIKAFSEFVEKKLITNKILGSLDNCLNQKIKPFDLR